MQEATNKELLQQRRLHWSLILVVCGYGLMLLFSILLLCYLRFNRRFAFQGNEKAARKLILPAFEPLIWLLICTTGLYVVGAAVAVKTYRRSLPNLVGECYYCGRQFVFCIVLVLMRQKSVSLPSLKRAIFLSIGLAAYSFPVVWILQSYLDSSTPTFSRIVVAIRAPILIFFTYVFINPSSRARPKVTRQFCVYVWLYHIMLWTFKLVLSPLQLVYSQTVISYTLQVWSALCPLMIWRVLRADTEYWRGFGQRACLRLSARNENIGGTDFGFTEQISTHGFHEVLEMHRKYVVDFAHLQIKQRIGVGSAAQVYKGLLKSNKHVAVKVYTPAILTEDTVVEFSNEAALCSCLQHPNIARFFGICINPPTVCILSELCLGSLTKVMYTYAQQQQPPEREDKLLKIAYMLDCSRAVAYMHSFSPAFLHRDIKPSNFLVDFNNNVKLSDFGETRAIPQAQGSTDNRGSDVSAYQDQCMQPDHLIQMTITGTVDYMAPEMIRGRSGLAAYDESVDIYALAMTLWDIMNPGKDHYPSFQDNHLIIFNNVIEGVRPDLEYVHPELRGLLAKAWHQDPSYRPRANEIVRALETIQEDYIAAFSRRVQVGMTANPQYNHHNMPSFSGSSVVQWMQNQRLVNSPGEAIRVGNALMDSGFMHHVKHERSFQDDDSAYYIDEVQTQSRPSYSTDEYLYDEDSDDNSSSLRTASEEHSWSFKSNTPKGKSSRRKKCHCRKLGQRLVKGKQFKRKNPPFSAHWPRGRRAARRCSVVIEEPGPLSVTLLDIDSSPVTMSGARNYITAA